MSARAPRLGLWLLIPVVALVGVVAFAIVAWLTVGASGPWPWWGFFPWFPFAGIWILFGFLFLFGVFRWSAGPWAWGGAPQSDNGDRSATILRERYARGEISRAQFDEMRRDLDGHLTHNAYEDDAAGKASP